MTELLRNVHYAVRQVHNSRGFTAVVVVTLALGIGATTAMFSVVDGVLLRTLPYPNAGRIVAINTSWPQKAKTIPRVTGPDIVDVRSGADVFDHLSFYYGGNLGVQLANHAEFVGTMWATPDFFSVFGVAPAYGRFFRDDDGKRSAVVSLAFAMRNFGSGPGALGKALHIEGVEYDVVGVLPSSFHFPDQTQVWPAIPNEPEAVWSHRTAFNYHAIASLKPGASLQTADAELRTIGARLQKAYPEENKDKTFLLVPLHEQVVGNTRTTLYFLMGAVSLLLLIACANVANLLLARATTRAREVGMRSALGATQGTIIRQLLVESGVLALIGGMLGLLIAYAVTALLASTTQERLSLPQAANIQLSWSVFGFAIMTSLMASLLFGLAPAWKASKSDLNEVLKASGRAVSGGSNRLRNALVVSQIALSFVLAIGAGLLFRSFLALTTVDIGLRTDSMLVMYAHDPAHSLADYLAAGRFFESVAADLRQMPGVKSVAVAMGVPMGGYGSNGDYGIDGDDFRRHPNESPHADFTLSSPSYFSTMGIPLLRGREFTPADRYESPFVAIISESLARQSFAGRDPIGHVIQCGLDGSQKWMTIVGVVADVRQDTPAMKPGPTLYMPLLQHPYFGNEVEVVVRSAVSATSLIDPVRARMLALNPEVPTRFTTMEAMISDTLATPRLRMSLASAFAVLALVLALAGIYSLISYTAAQRAPEFGVRMALGASPRQVVLLVLRRAALLTFVGVGIGMTLSAAGLRVISSMLFGVKASDATTYAAVLLALTVFAVLAALLPARRAAKVDPMVALRYE